MAKRSAEIIEVTVPQLEALLERAASNTLREEDTELMRQIFASYLEFFQMVGDKNTTIARLRKLLFGSTSEQAKKILEQLVDHCGKSREKSTSSEDDSEAKEPPAGHGRHSADDYAGGEQIPIPHPTLQAGDKCPECEKGTLYEKTPSVIVRFLGQAPVHARVYRLQRLRCHLCGKLFTAPAPVDAADEKYDHTVASMIGLLKYGSGLPFNRLDRLQRNCEIPLAASTQWEIIFAAATLIRPAYEELIRQAAQGEVVHNDDTSVRILELMGERLAKRPLDEQEAPGRTGLYTSGVVSTLDGIRVALYFSGRQHAGENLSDVLQHRAKELGSPIQMCDGLSRNLPKQLSTIVANCLAHGRRNFVDLVDRFPEECRHVIEAFKVIYRNDKAARKRKLNAEQRLTYHQKYSQATMSALKAWLQRQFDEKLVEPNSALGEAIVYLQKRWEGLTLFLREPGAPLDNNICERALKKAILHRKNSLFYKSRTGAMVGDMYMSLIYTCELNDTNAFDYLNQLQIHSADVAHDPGNWMPWTYHENLATSPA